MSDFCYQNVKRMLNRASQTGPPYIHNNKGVYKVGTTTATKYPRVSCIPHMILKHGLVYVKVYLYVYIYIYIYVYLYVYIYVYVYVIHNTRIRIHITYSYTYRIRIRICISFFKVGATTANKYSRVDCIPHMFLKHGFLRVQISLWDQ